MTFECSADWLKQNDIEQNDARQYYINQNETELNNITKIET